MSPEWWCGAGIIIRYIFDDNLSPYSRVKTASGQTKFKAS